MTGEGLKGHVGVKRYIGLCAAECCPNRLRINGTVKIQHAALPDFVIEIQGHSEHVHKAAMRLDAMGRRPVMRKGASWRIPFADRFQVRKPNHRAIVEPLESDANVRE